LATVGLLLQVRADDHEEVRLRSRCILGCLRILCHPQIDVTMNVYPGVSGEETLKALKRFGRQLGS
jgi:hypothetical protein